MFTYVRKYKEIFKKHAEIHKTLHFTLNDIEKREYATLKRVMQDWLQDKKCRSDVTIYREAKLCINLYGLDYLKDHWEPSENAAWFRDNVLYGITRPYKKFRVLYGWVEDEIDDNGSILVSEVREQAGILVAQKFGTYKKFEKLGERMKKFLGLKCIGESGKPARWIYA